MRLNKEINMKTYFLDFIFSLTFSEIGFHLLLDSLVVGLPFGTIGIGFLIFSV